MSIGDMAAAMQTAGSGGAPSPEIKADPVQAGQFTDGVFEHHVIIFDNGAQAIVTMENGKFVDFEKFCSVPAGWNCKKIIEFVAGSELPHPKMVVVPASRDTGWEERVEFEMTDNTNRSWDDGRWWVKCPTCQKEVPEDQAQHGGQCPDCAGMWPCSEPECPEWQDRGHFMMCRACARKAGIV